MFYSSCKVCDRVLSFADAELVTALQCQEHGPKSIPNYVGAVATEHGSHVVEWVDANPGCTGGSLAEKFGARELDEERKVHAPPSDDVRRTESENDYEPPTVTRLGSLRDLAPKESPRKVVHEHSKPSKHSKSHR